MIKFTFRDWHLTPAAMESQQFDNETIELVIEGEMPAACQWLAYITHGADLNAITFRRSDADGITTLSHTFSASELCFQGAYTLQLVGVDGKLRRHTNVETFRVPKSVTGEGHWPALPTIIEETLSLAAEAAGEAQVSAATASAAAESALESASTAQDSSAEATAAAQSAEQSKSAAESAANSARSSATSANIALTSAQSAALSASRNAAEAVTAADTSTSAAATASASATSAAADATRAETSAASAAAAAENAAAKAAEAEASAVRAEDAMTTKADKADLDELADRVTDLDGIILVNWELGRYQFQNKDRVEKYNSTPETGIRSVNPVHLIDGDVVTINEDYDGIARVFVGRNLPEGGTEAKNSNQTSKIISITVEDDYYIMLIKYPDTTAVTDISELSGAISINRHVSEKITMEKVADYTVVTEEVSINVELSKPCRDLIVRVDYKSPAGQSTTVTVESYSEGAHADYLARAANANGERWIEVNVTDKHGFRDIIFTASSSNSNVGSALMLGGRFKDAVKLSQKPIDTINVNVSTGAVVGAGTRVEVWGC